MGPAYLSGERIYHRAPVKADAEVAAAWFPSVYPIGSTRAEAFLKEHLKTAWWPGHDLRLVIVRAADNHVVGGVDVEHPTGPGAIVQFRLAPFLAPDAADEVQADALRLLVRWLLDEAEVLTITVGVGADQQHTLDAAGELGMERGIRLREFLARPGGRTDLIQLQALNPRRAARVGPEGDVASIQGHAK